MTENESISYTKKIGNVTFVVNLKSADDAKKTLEDRLKTLIFNELNAVDFDADSE